MLIFWGVDIQEANLLGANLLGVDFRGADLREAKIDDIIAARLSILQDEGDIVGWKKCQNNVIVKLLIRDGTPRSNSTGRSCRAKEATVLQVFGAKCGYSNYNSNFIYETGKTVECEHWDEDRWNECSGGIHFFITRVEAEEY